MSNNVIVKSWYQAVDCFGHTEYKSKDYVFGFAEVQGCLEADMVELYWIGVFSLLTSDCARNHGQTLLCLQWYAAILFF